MMKTISASALIAAMATTSFAGALTDATVESEPTDVFVPAPSSGIGAPAIIGGVVAAAAIAAIASNDGNSTTTTPVATAASE